MKRHIGWSNACTIACLDNGKMDAAARHRLAQKGVKSAKTQTTRRGRKVFTGTEALKSTGNLDLRRSKELLLALELFCMRTRFHRWT